MRAPPRARQNSERAVPEAAPSGKRPRRASARLVAAAESALPPLLRALDGDLLRALAKHLDEADLPCFRLTCRDFRDHSSKPEKKSRKAFLRTRALVVFAWTSMPGFVIVNVAAWDPSMLSLAASVGCVDVLEELVDNRQCELTPYACASAAAAEGHLGALGWLHSRGCPWGSSTCSSAAARGHLEVLRYAHEHGCPWDSYTCHYAAAGGHLEVLRYAHEHGCPWNSGTCIFAADGGHLEMLRYAHEHGCPWGISTCYNAAARGHLEVLRYAHEHGCPVDFDDCHEVAEQNGHAAVVEYLRAAQPAA
jgi:hypothetical protein